MDYIEIENEFLNIKVQLLGAQMISLYDKQFHRELLWQKDPQVWNESSPILFPIVGNLNNKTYSINGIKYNLDRHGFAKNSIFKIDEVDQISVSLKLTSNTKTNELYPFDFIFKVKYKLENSTLKVCFEVENKSENSMYFNLGAHPGFRVPNNNWEIFSDYFLQFEKNEKLSSFDIDSYGLINGNSTDLFTDENVLKLGNHLNPGRSLIFEKLNSNYVDLKSPNSKSFIRVNFSEFSNLLFWRAKSDNSNFVCIEPWEGLPDESGYEGDFKTKRGIVKLVPDEIFRRSFSISIMNYEF